MNNIDQVIWLAKKLYKEENNDNYANIGKYNECLRRSADINNRINVMLQILPWENDEPVIKILKGIGAIIRQEGKTGELIEGYMKEYADGKWGIMQLAEASVRDLCPDKLQYLH